MLAKVVFETSDHFVRIPSNDIAADYSCNFSIFVRCEIVSCGEIIAFIVDDRASHGLNSAFVAALRDFLLKRV